MNANQEDIDLLLAFEQDSTTHLFLVEAKADTGWTVRQIASKARRLRRIFGEDGLAFEGVEPHFVLVSHNPLSHLDAKLTARHDSPPAWMRPNGKLAWVQLDMPPERLVITRCDEDGRASKTGERWRVK